MLAKAGNGKMPHNTRAMAYFVRTIRLLNEYHIKPLIVIMPYHPRVLNAFLSVGWGVKQRWLTSYLSRLSGAPRLQGARLPAASARSAARRTGSTTARTSPRNSRRLIRYCITHAPGCFGLPKPPTPTPSAEPVAELERRAGAAGRAAPAYTPVPEDTSVPADFLE